jgi:hypothetical protein
VVMNEVVSKTSEIVVGYVMWEGMWYLVVEETSWETVGNMSRRPKIGEEMGVPKAQCASK